MFKLTITAGTQMDRNSQPLNEAEVKVAVNAINAALAARFGGFTLTRVTGGYTMANGQLVLEQSVRWEMVTDKVSDTGAGYLLALDNARAIRDALNQESVMMEVSPANVEFV